MSQDRATFQQLAETRLAEAKLLLANGLPSGAYYLAGYTIECALKARIAKDFRAGEIPDRKLVDRVYVHDLNKLLGLAGGLETAMNEDLNLRKRWTTVARWSESARYIAWTQEDAIAILDAIDGDEGLLQWLRNRW
jgi:hypothetical protein